MRRAEALHHAESTASTPRARTTSAWRIRGGHCKFCLYIFCKVSIHITQTGHRFVPAEPARKGIKDVFYETRVLMGRGFSVRRFAEEVLGGSVEPITLNFIEKGTRFPTEALVRRLAAVRKEDPHGLLALLWRDRMTYAFGRELRRVLQAPRGVSGIEDADLAVLVSHAIASLPPDDEWMSLAAWRTSVRAVPRRPGQTAAASRAQLVHVEKLLKERKLIEVRSG